MQEPTKDQNLQNTVRPKKVYQPPIVVDLGTVNAQTQSGIDSGSLADGGSS